MTLAVERVLQDPAHFSPPTNCYFHSLPVCCMLDGRYRAARWEGRKAVSSDPDLDASHTRLFSSVDQGATWSLLTDFDVPLHTQWNGLFSTGGNRLLASTFDKADYAYDASFSLIPRSEDGGLTWTSAVSAGFFGSLTFTALTLGFVKLPNTITVLAYGRYEVGGVPFNFLRSTDDGLTFTAFSDMGVFLVGNAVALSATEIVAVDVNGADPMYSTDGGATWNAATKPAGFTTLLFTFAAMGSGVVLAFGRTTIANLGTIFRSTDSGQTYVTHALVGGETRSAHTIRAVTMTTLIVSATGPSPAPSPQKWWLSEDAGDTWTPAAIVGPVIPDAVSTHMTVTSAGFMLSGVTRPPGPTTVTADHVAEIWRGTVAGLVPTGIGTCEALLAPPLAAAVMGVRIDCVPILTPPVCPPVCAADPVQPEGVLVIPDAPGVFGGGFRSALYLLGLAEGVVVVTPPIGILGRPATCGALIVNNNCAVAGC